MCHRTAHASPHLEIIHSIMQLIAVQIALKINMQNARRDYNNSVALLPAA